MTEFIPKGFSGLPSAIWYMSTKMYPELWLPGAMNAREAPIWLTRIVQNNDAKWLEDRLRYPFFAAKEAFPEAVGLRIAAYYEAEKQLRSALYSAELKAYFVSAAAETSGELLHVLPAGWGTDAGQEILWCGRADLNGEPLGRIIFVDIYSLRQHFFKDASDEPAVASTPAETQGGRSASPLRRGRPPAYDWAAAEAYAMGVLEHHGGPSPDDPELPSQAALEGLISDFLSKKHDRVPSESVVRDKAKIWIDAFRAGQDA